MTGKEFNEQLLKAKVFLLNMSRGNVPLRPSSPYGHLTNDTQAISESARIAYEMLRHVQPQKE